MFHPTRDAKSPDGRYKPSPPDDRAGWSPRDRPVRGFPLALVRRRREFQSRSPADATGNRVSNWNAHFCTGGIVLNRNVRLQCLVVALCHANRGRNGFRRRLFSNGPSIDGLPGRWA